MTFIASTHGPVRLVEVRGLSNPMSFIFDYRYCSFNVDSSIHGAIIKNHEDMVQNPNLYNFTNIFVNLKNTLNSVQFQVSVMVHLDR
jgi:hypothetical protein